MVCTLWVSEKDLNGACAKAMAAHSTLPLLLGKEWARRLRCPSAARARCSSTAATKSTQSSRLLPMGGETSLILRLDLHVHPHRLPIPNHARNLRGSVSGWVMLPPSCLEQLWATAAALPDQAPGLGSGTCMAWQPLGKGQHWALQAGLCPAARAGWHCLGCCGMGRKSHYNTLLQNTLLSWSQSQHQCP